MDTRVQIEVDREDDGRWIAEAPSIPGVMAYGTTRDAAIASVEAMVLRVLADRLERGDPAPEVRRLFAA